MGPNELSPCPLALYADAMRLRVVSFLLLSGLAACDCSQAPSPQTRATGATTATTATTEGPGEADTAGALPAAEDVSFYTLDGVQVHGRLFPSRTRDANAVVLVHAFGSDRSEWREWVDAFQAPPASLTVLTIDLRGHGESLRNEAGEPLDTTTFDSGAWARASGDVAAAVAWLRGPASPVAPPHVALVGASFGATAVVRAAVELPDADVLVLLSPGRAYRGVDSILVATEMGPRHLLAVAARDELDATETAEALARITHGRADLRDGEGHGTALLRLHPDLAGEIVDFVRNGLDTPPSDPIEP